MAAMRSCVVIWRSGVYRSSMELGNWRSSSSLRYLSDGRVLNEEERAQETIYIQKMERERMEKMKKKKKEAEQEQVDKDKSDKAGADANKS